MVIHNFHIKGISVLPLEANPPWVIHPDAVPAGAVTFHCFQMVAIRNPQIIQRPRLMQHQQFPPGHLLNCTGNRREDPSLNSFSVSGQAKLRIMLKRL